MKKGFTLVELLAVLVILALVGIIIVPNALRTSSKTEKKAFEEDVKAMLRYCIERDATDPYDPLEEIPVPNEEVDLKENTYTGSIIIEDGNFKAVNITNNKYCANGFRNSLEITSGNCE